MSVWNKCKSSFNKYVRFGGQGSKREYRAIFLPYLLVSVVRWVIASTHTSAEGALQVHGYIGMLYWLDTVLLVVMTIPVLQAAFRRAHDAGRSGWWIWVPFYEYILLFKNSAPKADVYAAGAVSNSWSVGELVEVA